MTLDQAVINFAAQYTSDDTLKADGVLDLVSGGIRRKGAPLPVLYADQERAVDEWFADLFANAELLGPRYRWIEKPELRQYAMTISDVPAMHRATDSRWVVESRIVFSH